MQHFVSRLWCLLPFLNWGAMVHRTVVHQPWSKEKWLISSRHSAHAANDSSHLACREIALIFSRIVHLLISHVTHDATLQIY